MQQQLIIYLRAKDNTHPDWVVINEEAGIEQSVHQGNPDALAELAEVSQVIVLVPAEEVVLTSAKLPKMNRAHLAKALPFALEEQVIEDVGTLHFASAENQADENLAVCIVAKNKMQEWLDILQIWNVEADIIMPVTFGLPVTENTWHAVLGEMAIVRMNAYQGFACDVNNVSEMLSLALHAADQPPALLQIQNYSEHAFATTLNVPVKEDVHKETQLTTDIAKHVLQYPYINLLQGMYKSKKSHFPEMGKLKKVAVMLSVAWVSLLVLYPAVSWLILHNRVQNINAQIAVIYKKYFPDAANIVAPKLRMQEKLQSMLAGAGESRLLILLGTLGKGMHDAKGITIKRLNFQQHGLNVELSAASSQAFASLTDYLTNQGLHVKQDSANLAGTRVNAVITVE